MSDEITGLTTQAPQKEGSERQSGEEAVKSDEQLRAVAERLLMDTRLKSMPESSMNFDPHTGEDLRARPNKLCAELFFL